MKTRKQSLAGILLSSLGKTPLHPPFGVFGVRSSAEDLSTLRVTDDGNLRVIEKPHALKVGEQT